MKYKTGHTLIVYTPSPCLFSEGDLIDVVPATGQRDLQRARIVAINCNHVTLRVPSRWEIFCYLLRHPRLWKRALDIPFYPPDILVRP